MDDIIYIVLGLLWLVFTFYTQSRKQKKKRELAQQKQQKQQLEEQEATTEKPKTIFDELFREELTVEEPEPAFEEPSVLPEEKQSGKFKTFEDLYTNQGIQSEEVSQGKYYEEGQSALKDKQKKDPKSLRSVKEELREPVGFDLRKAVIYAEILNRPYA